MCAVCAFLTAVRKDFECVGTARRRRERSLVWEERKRIGKKRENDL